MYNLNNLKQTIVTAAKRVFHRFTQEIPNTQIQSLYKPRPSGKPNSTVSGGSRNRRK
ncbi:MAG: hypothetical protein ACFB14_08170 [Leptolyngbyaceae cyanobacterium]